MSIVLKQNWGVFFAFLIIVSLSIGLFDLYFDNKKIRDENNQLGEELDSLSNEIDYINELLEQKQKENKLIQEENNITREELLQSKEYIHILESIVAELEGNETFLWSEIDFYEEAINIVGRKDVENLLIAYSIQAKELDDLKKQYNELLVEYNYLLAQQP